MQSTTTPTHAHMGTRTQHIAHRYLNMLRDVTMVVKRPSGRSERSSAMTASASDSVPWCNAVPILMQIHIRKMIIIITSYVTTCTHRACTHKSARKRAIKHVLTHVCSKQTCHKLHAHLPARRRQCDPVWRGHPQRRCRPQRSLARALRAPPATAPVVCSRLAK